jgi:hypothetical protein
LAGARMAGLVVMRHMRAKMSAGRHPSMARLVLLHVAVVVIAVTALISCGSSRPSDEQIFQAIRPQNAYLFNPNGQPRFRITKVVQPQSGWYVVKIKLTDVQTETGTVILRQDNPPDGPLTLYAGPGTAFPPENVHLPDAVRRAL